MRIENPPSDPDTTPVAVPWIRMFTPTSGAPAVSVTRPLTTLSGAFCGAEAFPPPASATDHDRVVVDRVFEPRAAQRFVEHFAHRGVGLAEGDAADSPHGVAIIEDVISRLLFDPLENFGQRRVAERYGDAFPALLVGFARRRLPGRAPDGNRQQPHAHGKPWPLVRY